VLAFPEAALCGYASDPEYWATADPAAFAAAEATVVRAAARHGLAVILGTCRAPTRRPGSKLARQNV